MSVFRVESNCAETMDIVCCTREEFRLYSFRRFGGISTKTSKIELGIEAFGATLQHETSRIWLPNCEQPNGSAPS